MKTQSKHRLIGSFVLLALLAIFLPLLFHHTHPALQTNVSNHIPTPPAMQDIQLPLPQAKATSLKVVEPPSQVLDQKPDQTRAQKQKQSVKKPITEISATLLKMPEAWTLQVATFSSKKNAQHLLKKLRSKGFDVYTKSVEINNKTLIKVYVGPQIDQGRLKSLQHKLKKQYRLNGVIAKYSA